MNVMLPRFDTALADAAVKLEIDVIASRIGVPSDQVAAMAAGTSTEVPTPETFKRRLSELVEILHRVEPWAGGLQQALIWYRGQSIPAFGDQTAEALVKRGRADAVRSYLDGIAVGGYA